MLFCEVNGVLKESGHLDAQFREDVAYDWPVSLNQFLEVCFEDVEVLFRCPFWIQCWRWLQTIARLCPVQRDYKNDSVNRSATDSAQPT